VNPPISTFLACKENWYFESLFNNSKKESKTKYRPVRSCNLTITYFQNRLILVKETAVWIWFKFHVISLVWCVVETMDSLKMNKYMIMVFRSKAKV